MSSSGILPDSETLGQHAQPPQPLSDMEREYNFFVCTEEPSQPDGPSRGLIRRLVMRNFFDARSTDPENNASQHNSASTVEAKKRLKTRFRLRRPGQEVPVPNARSKKTLVSRSPGEEVTRQEKRLRLSKNTAAQIGPSTHLARSRHDTQGVSAGEEEEEEVVDAKTKPPILVKINLNAHRFDPFDVLPVPGSPQLDMLFKLYKGGPRINSIAINPRFTWFKFISNDAGLLHATLATWALYGIGRGIAELHIEKLKHKNEAIREINAKIAGSSGNISDELVGAVLTLASFENTLGAYDAAQLHIAALKRMVDARGGIFAFGHNDGLVRAMLWVDLHSAAAFRTPPTFPQIRLDPDTPPLPYGLLEEAAVTSPTSFLQLSLASIECFNIFYRLHRLALASTSQWLPKTDRLTLSNLLYETQYLVLSVPDYSRQFLDLDREPHDIIEDENWHNRKDAAHAASIVEALMASVQIFVSAAMRELQPKTRIFSILLERLRVALDRPNVCTVHIWKERNNLNALLWVVVVGASFAAWWGDRSWWIDRLAGVINEIGIHSELDLRACMRCIAWTDIFFESALPSMWQELQSLEKPREEDQRTQAVLEAERAVAHVRPDPVEQPGIAVGHSDGRWNVGGWYV